MMLTKLSRIKSICQQFFASGWREVIHSEFIRKIGETFFTRVLIIGMGLVTTAIVARILGPEGRGLFAVAVTVGTIGVQFGNLGFHASNVYFVARNPELLPSLVGNTLLISFGFGTFCALMAWLFFILRPGIAPLQGIMLVLSLLWIPFGLATLLLENLLIGIQEIRAYNIIEFTAKMITIALLGLVIIFGSATVEMVFVTGLATQVFCVIYSLWRLKRHFACYPGISIRLFGDTIRYGFKAYLAAFLFYLLIKFNLLMIHYMLGKQEAGYFSIATTLWDMVLILPTITGTLLFARLSSIEDLRRKWQIVQKTVRGIFMVTIPVIIATVLLANQIIGLLYGEAFLPAVPVVYWLMPGALFVAMGTIYQNYLGASGNVSLMIYGPLAALLVDVVCNYFLIGKLGIAGAAMADSIAYGISLSVSWAVCIIKTNKMLEISD
jgi:O-antigen/teichoic acid export membrane protein